MTKVFEQWVIRYINKPRYLNETIFIINCTFVTTATYQFLSRCKKICNKFVVIFIVYYYFFLICFKFYNYKLRRYKMTMVVARYSGNEISENFAQFT